MALIVYPTDGWDTFVSVTDADAIIGQFVDDGGYLDLTEPEKEAHLRQATLLIRTCPSIVLPETAESDLQTAECYLAVYAQTTNMTEYDPNTGAIIEEHAGEVGVSYESGRKTGDMTDFPPIVDVLLKPYGCKKTGGAFSMNTLERS